MSTLSNLLLSEVAEFMLHKSCYFLTFVRSSRPEAFCKKYVLKNFAKFTEKILSWSFFFNKVAVLRHRCFPVKFAKLSGTFFYRAPPVARSDFSCRLEVKYQKNLDV